MTMSDSTTLSKPTTRSFASSSSASAASQPPPARSSTLKQRRVSLPSNANSNTTLTRLATDMPPPTSIPSQWATGFRDDSGLSTRASSSSSYSNVSLPSTSSAPSELGGRRRRAATVTYNNGNVNVPPKVTRAAGALVVPVPPPTAQEAPLTPTSSAPSTPLVSAKPRKPRKRWTMEETQALVDGCNKWGVGNWKAILNDTSFQFQGRSPVDLKDRFRTYFPDAYRHHYPNAKTHLSTRVRSFLPDGTSIFEKTRSKKRRPFSAEEDEALRLGYEKHGTTWATIVKDPVFAPQERRSTDLRDRFRNAFPELYKAAGYKPRPRAGGSGESTGKVLVKKGRGRGTGNGAVPGTSETSRALLPSSVDVVAGKKKRATLRPNEATAIDFYRPRPEPEAEVEEETPLLTDTEEENENENEDEDDSRSSSRGRWDEEDEDDERYFPSSSFRGSKTSSGTTSPAKTEPVFAVPANPKREEDMDVDGDDIFPDDDGIDGTAMHKHVSSPHRSFASSPHHSIQDLLDSASSSRSPVINPGLNFANDPLPLFLAHRPQIHPHDSSEASSASITSDDWSSMHNGQTANWVSSSPATWLSNPASPSPSDFFPQPSHPHRIGKSAWGPQDWLSANPRLDNGGPGALTAWPSHPTSDVLDRYDLYSTVEAAHDYASEADVRPVHHHHPNAYPDDSIFRGFTHHRYAGDLIPGSGVAVHPPTLHMGVGVGFGTEFGGALQDIDELREVNHRGLGLGIGGQTITSPLKEHEHVLDLDSMIHVAVGENGGPLLSLGLPDHLGLPSMDEAGAITPTTLNPASLPCPPSPLRLDQPRLPTSYPQRPHSRSVNQFPGGFRPSTPNSFRSISQPPSEHRQALQRSLSYLDPIGVGGLLPYDDPLAYSEPPSISSLDLQYGVSAGPNIFTPLTMFSDPPSIAPLRTITSAGTTTPPPVRNHQRHQSQSTAAGDVKDLHAAHRKRSSWDGGPGMYGVLPATDDVFFH